MTLRVLDSSLEITFQFKNPPRRWILKLEGHLSIRENTLDSLVLMYEKLDKLGFIYNNGKVEYLGGLSDD